MNELAVDFDALVSRRVSWENYKLPTIPAASIRLMKLVADQQSTPGDMEKAVAMDPVLASQIFKVANSCVYGGVVQVSSLKAAFLRMGRKQIRSIITMTAIKSCLISDKVFLAPIKLIWEHSVCCAFFGRELAQRTGQDSEEFFLVGLFHNIGQLMILSLLHDVLQQSSLDLSPELLGKLYESHQQGMSRQLLAAWKISQNVADVINAWLAQGNSDATEAAPPDQRRATATLQLACHLCRMVEADRVDAAPLLDELKLLQLPEQIVPELANRIKEIKKEIMAFV